MKIFITGPSNVNKLIISEGLYKLRPSEYNIPKRFSTDDTYTIHMSDNEVNLGYKNNSFLFILENKSNSSYYGITMDEYSNASVIPVELAEFNYIPERFLEANEVLIIWLDTKQKSLNKKKDVIETKFLLDRINYAKLHYLYFLDENENTIIKTINDYVQFEELRKKIFEKYS